MLVIPSYSASSANCLGAAVELLYSGVETKEFLSQLYNQISQANQSLSCLIPMIFPIFSACVCVCGGAFSGENELYEHAKMQENFLQVSQLVPRKTYSRDSTKANYESSLFSLNLWSLFMDHFSMYCLNQCLTGYNFVTLVSLVCLYLGAGHQTIRQNIFHMI